MKHAKHPGAVLKKLCRDLPRINDPTITWGQNERYLTILTWTRALSAFSILLVAVGGTLWIYLQLKQSPSQRYLQECQQQGQSPDQCSYQWNQQ